MKYELWIKRRKDCEPGEWVLWISGTFDEVMEEFFYTRSMNTEGLEGLRIELMVSL